MLPKAFLNWSGGKDSALALWAAGQQQISIGTLLTVVNKSFNRVAMHGLRLGLLQRQAASLGLPLQTVALPQMPAPAVYEKALRTAHGQLRALGYTQAIFGDLFLEDLKVYRQDLLAQDDLSCLFPLWKTDTTALFRQFIAAGFKAIVICVNSAFLDQSFCGRLLDESFINDLPPHVDPCGENGEYHSFVFDGPLFSSAIAFTKGSIAYKQYKAPTLAQTTSLNKATTMAKAGFYLQDLVTA